LPDPLLVAVADALAFSEAEMAAAEEKRELMARAKTLTQRENEVMQLVVTGLLNKQIAAQMGISEITAKVHKRRVMEKMKMRTLSDLVKATEKLNHDKDKHSQG
jgi:FixJ family two-component response regulator